MKMKTLIFFERDIKKINRDSLLPSKRWEALIEYAEKNDVLLSPDLSKRPGDGEVRKIEPGMGLMANIFKPVEIKANEIQKTIEKAIWNYRIFYIAAIGSIIGLLTLLVSICK